jgi:hypothetical protein
VPRTVIGDGAGIVDHITLPGAVDDGAVICQYVTGPQRVGAGGIQKVVDDPIAVGLDIASPHPGWGFNKRQQAAEPILRERPQPSALFVGRRSYEP